ncbi:MAG: hypothetical protein FWB78_11965 [Treponema sp.]|nr:hypothetical protein [Treponema sp.]
MDMKKTILILMLPLFAQTLVAESGDANDTTYSSEIESSPGIFLQATSSPAAKLGFNWHFTIPFLQGDSPLTQGNNIRITPGMEITPIDIHLTANAVWTPIAFVELVAGGRIGSGWNINLFGGDIYGIGLNLAEEPDAHGVVGARHCGNAFDGLFWQGRMGAALQGDLAAFFPGEWNHVIFRSFHEISYAAYSRAGRNQTWFFENDDGENRNGFSYRGNLLIGYRMPLFLNMVAFQAEADLFLTRLPSGNQWGDDRLRWTFSGLLNFAITESFEIALITQLRTRRNYENLNWEDLHFTARTLDTSSPLRLEFYRVVAAFTYRF